MKRFSIAHRLSGTAVVFVVFCLLWSPLICAANTPESELSSLRLTYDRLLAGFNQGNTLIGRDNLGGAIVWGEGYVLQSFLEMFIATEDISYLDRFVQHADTVAAQRGGIGGHKDWQNQDRLGWQTAGHYTFGKPMILQDKHGANSLEVRAIHRAGNHATTIEVKEGKDGHYRLRVVNTFRRTKPVVLDFDGLTQETVEARVNGVLSLDKYIWIRRLSGTPPAPTPTPVRFIPQKVVLSTFHSPFILTPFTWFVYLVRQRKLTKFAEKAETYADMAKAVYEQNEPSWEDHATFGFYRIEPDIPFWAAGLPAPINAQSAHGLYILYLALSTGERNYLDRVKQLAGLISRQVKMTAAGQYTMPYWFGEGRDGWDLTRDRPGPQGNLYTRYKGARGIEDASHGAWTAQFVWTAYRAGVAFTTADMKRWGMTARYIVSEQAPTSGIRGSFPPADDTFNRKKADSKLNKPAYNYAAATWALFAVHGHPMLYERAYKLYRVRYARPTSSGVVLLGWARLVRLASELGR